MNIITLAGRLTAEPELKTTNSGLEVMSFTIAVNRRFAKQDEQETDFINCVAWRKTAVFISTYFHKGDGINLVGRLESRKWTDSDGRNRTSYEVIVDNVEFPLGKSRNSTENGYSQPQQTCTAQPAQANDGFGELPLDEDMPF